MTSDEQLKSAPQGERSMWNVRRLIPRTQLLTTNRTVPEPAVPLATPHGFDNDEDPGPAAA